MQMRTQIEQNHMLRRGFAFSRALNAQLPRPVRQSSYQVIISQGKDTLVLDVLNDEPQRISVIRGVGQDELMRSLRPLVQRINDCGVTSFDVDGEFEINVKTSVARRRPRENQDERSR